MFLSMFFNLCCLWFFFIQGNCYRGQMFGRLALKHGFKIGCCKTRCTACSYGSVQITLLLSISTVCVKRNNVNIPRNVGFVSDLQMPVQCESSFKRKNFGSPLRSVVVGSRTTASRSRETVGERANHPCSIV